MTDLETRLRESLSAQVTETPHVFDLPGTVVARSKRVRRNRALACSAAALSVVAAFAVALVGSPSKPTSLQPGEGPRTGSATRAVAPQAWDDALLTTPTRSVPADVVVGGTLFRHDPVGHQALNADTVLAAAALPDGGTALIRRGPDGQQLVVVDASGTVSVRASDVGEGLAVQQGTSTAAYVDPRRSQLLVMDLLTGSVVASKQVTGRVVPVAWIGDRVLLTLGEGSAERASIWTPATAEVRDIGTPGTYDAALAAGGTGDLVALAKGYCVTVSHLTQAGDLWSQCSADDARFSPTGKRVLITESADNQVLTAVVRDAADGTESPALAFPGDGVLSVGWADDDTVTALVRSRESGGVVVIAVTCPVDGSTCTRRDILEDKGLGYVVDRLPETAP
jgi:hypothetical protein